MVPLFSYFLSLFSFAGLGWNYSCDLWSVGCILVELCSVSSHYLYLSSSLIFSIAQCRLREFAVLPIDMLPL